MEHRAISREVVQDEPDEGLPQKAPRLTREDIGSQTWKRLRAILLERQERLRAKNDSVDLDPIGTALIRGELRNLKNLLALEKNPAPAVVANEGDD